MVVDAGELGLSDAEAYVVRDLWAHQDTVTTGPIRAFVPRHGVAMFRVRPGAEGEAPPRVSVSLKAEESPYILPGESKHLSATLVNDGPLAIEEIQMELAAPAGWSAAPALAATPASPASPVIPPTLADGQMLTVGWVVTAPAGLPRGTVELPLSLTYRYGHGAGQTVQAAQLATVTAQTALAVPPAPPAKTSYLSDLEWVQAVNGWGPVERDRSNGETAARDGRTLTIRRQTFVKGLGVHAPSEIVYYLGGKAAKFMAVVGVDDEARPGSVVFQVWGDGRRLYDSGVLKGSSSPQPVEVDVRGVAELRLVVTDGGDGVNYDHADWADAKVIVTDEGL
jgi:alpha-galactosidase